MLLYYSISGEENSYENFKSYHWFNKQYVEDIPMSYDLYIKKHMVGGEYFHDGE